MCELPARVGQTVNPRSHRKSRADRKHACQFPGDQPEVTNRFSEWKVSAGALDEDPSKNVECDDRAGDDSTALGFVFISVRNHGCTSSCRYLAVWPLNR